MTAEQNNTVKIWRNRNLFDWMPAIDNALKGHYVVLVNKRSEFCNIYNVNKAIIQTQLFSEESKVPQKHSLELERWQGPPHINR